MRVSVKVKNRRFQFSTSRVEQIFWDKAEGHDFLIESDDDPSGEMRRFFEGAVVPAFFWLHPQAGWKDFKDAREAVKLEFIPSWTTTKEGDRIAYARSTKDLSKAKFTEFLEKVISYLRENFDEILDPEEYKRWRDSAPGPGEGYPQHLRLKALWEKARAIHS